MRFLDTILNIFFPSRCLACGKDNIDLCPKCLGEIPAAERECADWIYPIFDYRNLIIKKAIWSLKYKGRRNLAHIFAEIVYEKILEELSELSLLHNFTEPLIIPIPLSRKRLRERGFNQAELICRELVKISRLGRGTKLEIEKNILIKPKETEHQATLREREIRLKNIIGSFEVKKAEKIKNKNIILIDDVITTGATLSEARKILKKAGAKKVIAFAVAH